MGAVRWRIALVLSIAIAISYLDRQTLSVAIDAIQHDIPITNTDFSRLKIAFLVAYGLMYTGGGALIDVLGTRRGFFVIMVFWSLACASHGLAHGLLDRSPLSRFAARPRRGRRLPGGDEGRGRVVPRARALDGDGHHQRRHRRRRRDRAAADRRDHPRPLSWRWVFFITGGMPAWCGPCGGLRDTTRRRSIRASRRPRREPRSPRSYAAPAPNEPAMLVVVSLLARPRGLGTRAGEVPQRRRVVLLHASGCRSICSTRAASTSSRSATTPGFPTPPPASAA